MPFGGRVLIRWSLSFSTLLPSAHRRRHALCRRRRIHSVHENLTQGALSTYSVELRPLMESGPVGDWVSPQGREAANVSSSWRYSCRTWADTGYSGTLFTRLLVAYCLTTSMTLSKPWSSHWTQHWSPVSYSDRGAGMRPCPREDNITGLVYTDSTQHPNNIHTE